MAPGFRPPVFRTLPRNEPGPPPNSPGHGSRGGVGSGSDSAADPTSPAAAAVAAGRRHQGDRPEQSRAEAQPRVQWNNEAEEELLPKAGKIGHQNYSPSRFRLLPKYSLPDRPYSVFPCLLSPQLLLEVEPAWRGREKKVREI